MTDSPGDEKQRVVVELLVLAIARSPLKDVVAPELVRSALEMEIDVLVTSEKVDLDVAWKTIHQLPGFDAKSASPPFCWLKTLETRLNLPVELPDELKKLTSLERQSMSALCPVKAREIDHVLGGAPAPEPGEITGPVVSVEDTRPKRTTTPPDEKPKRPTRPPPQGISKRRKVMGIVAGVVALASAGFVTMTMMRACNPPADWVRFDVSDLSGIPVKNAEKLGNQVGATLSDPAWVVRPEAERRKQLEDALNRVRRKQVTTLFIKEDSGQVRASAQWVEATKKIVIKFY